MVELELGLQGPSRTMHQSYILGDLIGRGATSSVYKCLYKGKKECACKILRKSLLDRRRLEIELPDLMKLRHPHLIELRDRLDSADELTLVMELASGEELLERVAERGFYTEQTAAAAVRQILSALQCLHAAGHAHRALRPEKLVFASMEEEAPIKVLSVGLGRSSVLPTAQPYCAPEASRGAGASCASDMWSVGVIAYILLCGFEPFTADSSEDGLGPGEGLGLGQGDRDHHALRFPDPWWGDISESARDLVSQLLQTDPALRPTADQALEHPWVRGDTPRSKHMDATVRSLREFNARRKFRAATQAVVATQRLVSPEKRLSRVTLSSPPGAGAEATTPPEPHQDPELPLSAEEFRESSPVRWRSCAVSNDNEAVTPYQR